MIYDVLLSATFVDIKGTFHILRLFAYVLHDNQILFQLALPDQQTLDVDICLRKGHESHPNIIKWQSLPYLTV